MSFFQAVQEFTELCKNSAVDAVESALPFWPRLFNKLAMVRCVEMRREIYIFLLAIKISRQNTVSISVPHAKFLYIIIL